VRRLVPLLCLMAFLVAAAPAAAASSSSFRAWATGWERATDRAVNAALDPCQKHFGIDDQKAGACAVRNMTVVFRDVVPLWNRAVARVARGQTRACRTAIHSYWMTTRVRQAADVAYLATHARITVTELNAALADEPFSTLNRVAARAELRAVHVCG
jgi:hypothetical protein